jgi:hypothetical protein
MGTKKMNLNKTSNDDGTLKCKVYDGPDFVYLFNSNTSIWW